MEKMNSSGLECETWLVRWIQVSRLRTMFVEVCEWFDEFDRLKIVFKLRKKKITKLSFMLSMIKNYHDISLIYCKKILICIKKINIFY